MNYKTFRMIQALNGVLLGGIMGASLALGNWIIPVAAVIISLAVMMILRRRVKEIVADERTYAIAEKAARLTFQIVAIGMAIIGAILLGVSRSEVTGLTQTGFTLLYATCALLVINYFAYYYYSRKMGGRP
jgi:uncharacterized membrane protein